MYRVLLAFILFGCATNIGISAESVIKCSSPDGRFALRIAALPENKSAGFGIELIEKNSGEVLLDLENVYENHLSDTILVWSADSKKVAFGTRGNKEGETRVFFWNGSVFEEAALPDHLPVPKIQFGPVAGGGVKNYGGTVKPTRWLDSGELELSADSTMLSRVNNKTYTGVVLFTVSFDSHRHAVVRKVGKSNTSTD